MRSMAMGLPSSAYWPVRSFVALFIRKHGTLDEHCKHQSCDRDCWAYHNMLGTSNQLSLSARSPQCKKLSIYLYNEHLCRFSWCKKYWTYLHVSICVWHHVFLRTNLQSPASAPIFCRFAIVIWNDLNMIQFRAKGAFGVHPMIWSKMCRRTPFLSTWHGMDQTWVSTKLDGLRWFNLVLKPYSQLWLHGVSLYFNLESGLSLASGWNLCCAAISFIASHRLTPLISVRGGFVMLIGQFHIMAIFQWDDVVRQKIVTWPLGPNHRS